MSTPACRLRKSQPVASSPSSPVRLHAVPAPDTDEFAQLIAELAVEEKLPSQSSGSAWQDLRADEEALPAHGLPVALAAGHEFPEVVDEDADVHEAAVLNIQTARLHRYLRDMPPMDSKVVRLIWGIGCRPHTRAETATTTGLSRKAVNRALVRGMRELRVRFGVRFPDAA